MAKVWGVENKAGVGPYRGTGFDVLNHHTTSNGHPPPRMDGLSYEATYDKSYTFAFNDLESARKWFSWDELRDLRALGYHLVRIEVYKVSYVLGHQVIVLKQKQEAIL